MLVADEREAPHRHGLVLSDLELERHLVFPLRSDLVVDVSEKEALLGVSILYLLNATAHRRHAEDGVRLDLDGLVQLVILDLVVAVVADLLDVGPLTYDEAQHDAVVVGGQVYLDVFEEARVPQRPDVGGRVLDAKWLAGLLTQIRENVFARDPSVPHYVDGRYGQSLGLLSSGWRQRVRGRGSREVARRRDSGRRRSAVT